MLLMTQRLVCLIIASTLVYASRKDYKGWKSFYVRPSTLEQVQDIHSMVEEIPVDFLVTPTVKNEGVVLVKPENVKPFIKALNDLHISFKIHSNNINAALESDDKKIAQMETKNFAESERKVPYNNFYSEEIIYEYLVYISKHYRDRVTLVQAGKSFESRPLYYLKISTSNFHESKPIIIIDGGMHAREWISPTVVTYAIHKLVENVTESDLLDNFDWILFPMVNPDGYNYTFTYDRFWRKNRSKKFSCDCPGVDINRNFEYKWAANPSDPCREDYPGRRPLSEIESRILLKILRLHKNDTVMYINMHSYGSYILYPYSHDGSRPKNADTLQAFGDVMANAINLVTEFERYSVGNPVYLLGYEGTGTVLDYAHSIGIQLTFVFELPGFPIYNNGFIVDPSLIKPIVKETWGAIVSGARMIKTNSRLLTKGIKQRLLSRVTT